MNIPTLNINSGRRIVICMLAFTMFAGSFASLLVKSNDVAALKSSDFNAGNIMSDIVFTNKDTMSVSQIQSFLNSKVPNCDTNGLQTSEFGGPDLNSDGRVQRWEWGKANYNQTTFPCLKDYTQGGKKAAQIIYEAAQEYSINPQVLIVLLQKEQGLVTDTWPLNIQYRSATGYGCPDTAACDSQYYGLTNQVKWAATMFRAIINDSPTWYTPYETGTNYIQYNPQSSCGGSNVNVQNRTTQALYNYTPYQPNPATLAWKFDGARYPSCGAFGNLNFFVYFNEWFGSTLTNSFVKYTVYSSTTDTSGTTATIGVSLSSKPTADVSIQYGITSPSNAAFIGSSRVTIKPSTWNSPELNRITVKGLPNDALVGNMEYQVRASRPVTSDKRYSYIGGDQVGHITILHQDVTGDLPVYQLYSPSEVKHYYTANLSEKNEMESAGFEDRGIAFYYCSAGNTQIQSLLREDKEQRLEIIRSQAETNLKTALFEKSGVGFTGSTKGTVPIYRHYNATIDHSFYSVNASEATGQGYSSQGVAFTACRQGDTPVYRLYKPSTGTHYYTISPTDRDKVIRDGGYVYQDVAYYIQEGDTPVYRLYKPSTGTHYYTISPTDRDKVIRDGGYVSQGIAYSVQEGSLDVFRAYKPETGRHYYTTSEQEIDFIAENGGYIPQGVSLSISE